MTHDQALSRLPINDEDLIIHNDIEYYELEINPLSLLFFLKKVDEEAIVELFVNCVKYIIEKQEEARLKLVKVIYVEDWVFEIMPKKIMT